MRLFVDSMEVLTSNLGSGDLFSLWGDKTLYAGNYLKFAGGRVNVTENKQGTERPGVT